MGTKYSDAFVSSLSGEYRDRLPNTLRSEEHAPNHPIITSQYSMDQTEAKRDTLVDIKEPAIAEAECVHSQRETESSTRRDYLITVATGAFAAVILMLFEVCSIVDAFVVSKPAYANFLLGTKVAVFLMITLVSMIDACVLRPKCGANLHTDLYVGVKNGALSNIIGQVSVTALFNVLVHLKLFTSVLL